jgi:hypothetical protein
VLTQKINSSSVLKGQQLLAFFVPAVFVCKKVYGKTAIELTFDVDQSRLVEHSGILIGRETKGY